jgi:hypothetical protein
MANIGESLSRVAPRRALSVLACTAVGVAGLGAGVGLGCDSDDDQSLEPLATQTTSLEDTAREAKRKARQLERKLKRELPSP